MLRKIKSNIFGKDNLHCAGCESTVKFALHNYQGGINAREILDQCYARGELDREQYQAIKKDLQ